MGVVNFVLGGTRSGKSTYALNLAGAPGKKVAFVATSPYFDEDMTKRIEKHKAERPPEWDTYEETIEIPNLLKSLDNKYDIVLIDCLTLFTTNMMLENHDENAIKNKTHEMLDVLKEVSFDSVLVSNEVGLGTHPEHKLAREFRDIAGGVNQITASKADNVYFMVSGIPMVLKSSS